MLKKTLMIYVLAFCGIANLQAMQEEVSFQPVKYNSEKNQSMFANEEGKDEKDFHPGVLVCNGKEDKCLKEGDQSEFSSSILFSVFLADHEDEINLLACKDCR